MPIKKQEKKEPKINLDELIDLSNKKIDQFVTFHNGFIGQSMEDANIVAQIISKTNEEIMFLLEMNNLVLKILKDKKLIK